MPKKNCEYCNPRKSFVLIETSYCRLIIPKKMHISPDDGGHLIVVPCRHISTRLELLENEVLEMWRLSVVGAKALIRTLSTDWINYQENGNWTVDTPEKRHLHLHIYGRRRDSVSQPFGEALRFPLKRDFPLLKIKTYSNRQVELLRKYSLEAMHKIFFSKKVEK